MTVTVAQKKRIITRDGGFCLLALACCTGEAQTTDHRANRGMGGAPILDHPANLIAACTLCNGAKADAHALTLLDLEERGLWILPAATHAKTLERAIATPVMVLDGRRFRLVDHDTRELVAA
jgi:hypothetical protein